MIHSSEWCKYSGTGAGKVMAVEVVVTYGNGDSRGGGKVEPVAKSCVLMLTLLMMLAGIKCDTARVAEVKETILVIF